MGQSPCCGSSRAKEQGNARAEELRSGGAAWKAAARGAGGAGAAAASGRVAAERGHGRRFARKKGNRSETDAWARGRIK